MEQLSLDAIISVNRDLITKIWEETREEIGWLKSLQPRIDADIWFERTREIEKECSHLFEPVQCDGVYFYRGRNDQGIGVAGLISIRDEINYLFELVNWDPREVAEWYGWDTLEERLNWTFQLATTEVTWIPETLIQHDLSTIEGIKDDLKDAYYDETTKGYPWIVGYSGGKDSTLTLKLALQVLMDIPKEQRTRDIHVISADTLIETPMVTDLIRRNLVDIKRYVDAHELPVSIHVTRPDIDDTYFVCLIGKGYLPPKPGNIRRWCTYRLKTKATGKVIKQVSQKCGNRAILVLGTRHTESASRDKSMKKWESTGRYGFTDKSGVLSYPPIAYLTDDQVWKALEDGGLPWNDQFEKLKQLYKNTGTEVDILLDSQTSSGTRNRMGCLFCTLVNRDKSLESFIENGYEWLSPVLDFRSLIVDLEYDISMREPFPRDRRTAQATTRPATRWKKTSELLGGFNLKARQLMLKEVLKLQEHISEEMAKRGIEIYGGYEIISSDQIQRIKQWWKHLDNYTEPGLNLDDIFPSNAQLNIFEKEGSVIHASF